MSTACPDSNGITSICGYHEALGHKWQLFLPGRTVKAKPISISHYKDALGWSKKNLWSCLTLLSYTNCGTWNCPLPSWAPVSLPWNWRVQQFSITGCFTMLLQRKYALLLCLHSTPHPHQSLLATLLEFCNPSLSSFPLEILLSSFWQKLLLPVCDTMTHLMQLYYNRTGRWNGKLTHFWRTFCVPGTVQRRVTHSQLILKTTFKGWRLGIYHPEPRPMLPSCLGTGLAAAVVPCHLGSHQTTFPPQPQLPWCFRKVFPAPAPLDFPAAVTSPLPLYLSRFLNPASLL